jgi:mannose-6-phosphate isomerase
VLRCGLTAKHVDVPELLRVADFSELAEPRWPAAPVGQAGEGARPGAPGLPVGAEFLVPVEDFRLSLIDLDGYRKPGDDAGSCAVGLTGPCIVLCLEGLAGVLAGGACVEIPPGRAAYVCPREAAFEVTGRGRIVIASDGMRPDR